LDYYQGSRKIGDFFKMLISSVVSKLTKAGWTVKEPTGTRFQATKPGYVYVIEWLRNGRSNKAVCLEVRHVDAKDDLQADYHAGSYAPNIKTALQWADKWDDQHAQILAFNAVKFTSDGTEE
jgi:hypothetical protein